ncbi:AAA family ATPase [Microbacterium sp. NPDC056234]|uniref:AAA family ATPase n=1 Tax=Microbacterium sp. NPDC056234 TaxID=3345757 RepID=UPI0035DF80E6
MPFASVTHLNLVAFKSFRDEVLPLDDLTLLIGRNSAGKSNALDGLEVLARLAEGEDLIDALDGRRRELGPVRGGSEGCAPHGMDSFTLGCRVKSGDEVLKYTVQIEVRPDIRIIAESLHGWGVAVASGARSYGPIFETRRAGAPGTGIEAEIHNGKQGPNPLLRFRDSRLLLTQIPLVVSSSNRAERSVHAAVTTVQSVLRGVFHFDPIPHLMREFVKGRDVELRRTGENLSPALRNLQASDPEAFAHIEQLVRLIADDGVREISFVNSDLGDVMLALQESRGADEGAAERTPAREMSDGLLRFIGIATALLSPRNGLDIDAEVASPASLSESRSANGILIVLEELENGLHPSQAHRVLELVRESSKTAGTSVLITTHSPALLDAAEGSLNENIIVCHRDPETGHSRLTPITELPGYAVALAEGSLGTAVTTGKLTSAVTHEPDYAEFQRLLGLS